MAEKLDLFPKTGMKQEEIFNLMDEYKAEDSRWAEGRVFSLVYHVDDAHDEFIKKAHNKFFFENGLNPMAFKSLKKFEHETVRMCVDLFHGDHNAVGVVSSGGTESLLMAVKTYRDRARKIKPWIRNPEIIMPESAHVALDKAGHYFDVKIRHAPLTADCRVDIKAVKKMINRNTILLVGSAPQYPHGVIDPISQLGELALQHGLPLHVDACIGGFILPFLEKLGRPVPAFDFRVEGVTSISADLHKYGYTPKGASVLLYRSMNIMKYQFFAFTDWNGGIYASPALPGTRPGGPIAGAWATLKKMGEDGYLHEAKKVVKVVDYFLAEIEKIPELKMVAYPDSSLVCFTSKDPNIGIYAVADYMIEKGWHIDRQQKPESLHMTLSPNHEEPIKEFFLDLRDAVAHVKAHPELATSGQAAMYGMMAKIPFRGMIKSSVMSIMEKMYGPEGKMPDEKKEGIENWGDLAEKVAGNVMEVKRQLDTVIQKVKGPST